MSDEINIGRVLKTIQETYESLIKVIEKKLKTNIPQRADV